jgi:hypothetical protein
VSRPSRARAAAEDLARAFRTLDPSEESASLFDQIALILPDLIEGDYDVLIARKLRAVSDLLNSEGPSLSVLRAMRELRAEIKEAFGGGE